METDNGTRGSRSESGTDHLLRPCAAALSRRDFTACRELAYRVPRSDPNITSQVDQILAITDVLSAASRRLGNSHNLDWYSILQLRPADAENRDLARQQFKTLVRLLDPNKNKFPLADDALMRVREAWSILSDPVRRGQFDSEIRGDGTGPSNGPGNVDTTASFWTMCPYCWFLHEYETMYEDCTLRCGNCRRTFHGVAVKPPAPETLVEGKEQYYCYHLSLPLRYPVDERCGFGDNSEKMDVHGNGKRRLRIKTVAHRVRMKGFVEPDRD
ncbi:DnaJ domain containing protein [Sesbania bispinosa]|nr:DnaJ domain containing protein [Sesbania bispinosa]